MFVFRQLKLKKIELDDSCHNKNISIHKTYLVRAKDRVEYHLGTFDKEWYGWNFQGIYDAGEQLDQIEEVWEIVGGIKL